MSEKPASRGIAFSSMSMETGRWDVSAFSSYASICGDILISCGPRFSPYGDTVNLSRCFYSPAILTLCVNPQRERKQMKERERHRFRSTRKARRAIDKWVLSSRVLYWLDLGNNASSGQFVLGQRKNRL